MKVPGAQSRKTRLNLQEPAPYEFTLRTCLTPPTLNSANTHEVESTRDDHSKFSAQGFYWEMLAIEIYLQSSPLFQFYAFQGAGYSV